MKWKNKIYWIFFILGQLFVAIAIYNSDSRFLLYLVAGDMLSLAVFIFLVVKCRDLKRRIKGLAFDVEEIAAGNFSKNIKADDRDELNQLKNVLNDLLNRLRTGVAIDISKHQELQRAKTDFVAIASHQLRTPLSIIKWYVDFLINGDAGEITEEQKKYLSEVYRSNERLIELVNGLLDVSRIDLGTFSIEPEPTDVIERMETALHRYHKDIKLSDIYIKKEYDEIPIINLDPRLTKIVFENILSNAVKYTPKGGSIKITVKKTLRDVLIKVSDSGCGIPRDQQPKIFTKLFRADNVKRIESVGTGLGLYIARAVIEKSGGKIWFESPSLDLFIYEENKGRKTKPDVKNPGTTFFITIPLEGMKKKHGTKKLSSF